MLLQALEGVQADLQHVHEAVWGAGHHVAGRLAVQHNAPEREPRGRQPECQVVGLGELGPHEAACAASDVRQGLRAVPVRWEGAQVVRADSGAVQPPTAGRRAVVHNPAERRPDTALSEPGPHCGHEVDALHCEHHLGVPGRFHRPQDHPVWTDPAVLR